MMYSVIYPVSSNFRTVSTLLSEIKIPYLKNVLGCTTCRCLCIWCFGQSKPPGSVREQTRVGSMDWSFFNSYLAVPRPTMSHYQRSNLTQWMLITTFSQFGPKSHQEPHNKVGYLRRAETLVGFEPRTFRFWLQNLNQLGLSRQKIWKPYKFDNF